MSEYNIKHKIIFFIVIFYVTSKKYILMDFGYYRTLRNYEACLIFYSCYSTCRVVFVLLCRVQTIISFVSMMSFTISFKIYFMWSLQTIWRNIFLVFIDFRMEHAFYLAYVRHECFCCRKVDCRLRLSVSSILFKLRYSDFLRSRCYYRTAFTKSTPTIRHFPVADFTRKHNINLTH